MDVVFPRLIQKHKLNYDTEKLNQALMVAQAESVNNLDAQSLLEGVFKAMDWPEMLAKPFLQELQTNYQPKLYDDAIPFLQKLQQHNKTVYILSNNPLSVKRTEYFGLLPYVEAALTPDTLPGAPRKPDAKVWDALLTICPDLTKESATIVGDDPWAEGAFADVCGLPCWIIDRHQRYRTLYDTKPYHWVSSLNDIVIAK